MDGFLVFCLSTPFVMKYVSGIIPPTITCALLVSNGCAANVVTSLDVKKILGRNVSWERSMEMVPPYVVGSEENWHFGLILCSLHMSSYSL